MGIDPGEPCYMMDSAVEYDGIRDHLLERGPAMERFKATLLQIWREVCRHVEIAEAVSLIAPILGKRLPIELIMVRRIDLARSWVETVSLGRCTEVDLPERSRNVLKPEKLKELIQWCSQQKILRGRVASVDDAIKGAIPPDVRGEVLIGPLADDSGPSGLLILVGQKGAKFEAEHEGVLRDLLEPFSVALENDSRLKEINTLREAAEADKRTLLTRLGRQDVADTIVGADGGLRHVLERVSQVAGSDAPVMIFGETGSGKEVVARAIHSRSRRAQAPFHRVNCGAIPPDLIDSELFGHERGSFTGATATRKGWFERANGGTLFLDEIGELPLAAQVRLLRILQDGTFERVGGQRQLTVDVRIVAATHRNLQAMVADATFREDLWYRLAVFPIHLPALRDHPEDIPELATHFALKASRRFGTPPLTPTPEDINLLIGYPWPGNVRELQSVIERATILGDGRHLDVPRALGASVAPVSSIPRQPLQEHTSTTSEHFLTLDSAMRRHIEEALRKTSGRIEGTLGAAKLLDINPHTLRARMRKLGIKWNKYRSSHLHDASGA